MLIKVKNGLSVDDGEDLNNTIRSKMLAVKGYMINAGITKGQLESDLGIATLTIGVNDLWNLSAGDVKFSDAFTKMLMPQLMAVSLPD